MAKGLRLRREYPFGVKPSAVAVGLVAAGLLAFYGVLGVQYWIASQKTAYLQDEIKRITDEVRLQSLAAESLLQEPQSEEPYDQKVRALFNYPGTDGVLAVVIAAAKESQVRLTSLRLESSREEAHEDILYTIQPVSLSFQGGPTEAARFLSRLRAKAPVMTSSNVTFAELDKEGANAELNLLFYLWPTVVSNGKEAS